MYKKNEAVSKKKYIIKINSFYLNEFNFWIEDKKNAC